MDKLISFGLLATIASSTALAGPITFKVGAGSRAQQLAQVESVTDLETFTGRTDKVTGSITFDPAKRTGSGSITVDVASLNTGIDLRDEHLRSAGWLDSAKHPTITFVTTSVKSTGGDKYRVTGNLTLHGVTKQVTTTATVKHRVADETTKASGFKGDLLQTKTSFTVKLGDYGIMVPQMARAKVAETVTISITLYGQSG
jgi:polyisoprenoid-binding protein YceI